MFLSDKWYVNQIGFHLSFRFEFRALMKWNSAQIMEKNLSWNKPSSACLRLYIEKLGLLEVQKIPARISSIQQLTAG